MVWETANSTTGSLAWSPDGRWLAAGGMQNTRVRLWDATADKPGPVFQGAMNDGGASVAWSPDSKRIVSGSLDRTIRVWDVASGDTQWIAVLLDEANSATFTPAGQMLPSNEAAEKQLIYVVEQSDGALKLLTPTEFRNHVATAAKGTGAR